jgi:hypothetical protein
MESEITETSETDALHWRFGESFVQHSIAFSSLSSFSTGKGQHELHGLDRDLHALWKGIGQWPLS